MSEPITSMTMTEETSMTAKNIITINTEIAD